MITNFLSRFDFSNPQLTGEILFFVSVIWLVVVSCAIWSVCTRMRRWSGKLLWIFILVALPVVGLILYLPFSLDNDALQSLVRFGRRN